MSAIATFWFHDDIVALQKHLDADLEGVNNSVAACGTKVPDTMRTSWQAFYVSAKAFTQAPAAWINTGTQADRGQELQRELLAWQQQLSATCPVTPVDDPDKGKPNPLPYVKWIAIGAAALGVAWVTTEVAATVRLFKAPAKG